MYINVYLKIKQKINKLEMLLNSYFLNIPNFYRTIVIVECCYPFTKLK